MKVKLNVPQEGEGVELIVPGVGLVANGSTFEVSKELGAKLVKSDQFEEVDVKKGSEK